MQALRVLRWVFFQVVFDAVVAVAVRPVDLPQQFFEKRVLFAEQRGGFVVVAAHVHRRVVEVRAYVFLLEPVGQRLMLRRAGECVAFVPVGAVQRVVRGGGCNRRNGFGGFVVGDFYAKALAQWAQATLIALVDEAVFPSAVAAVDFAEDERGFAAVIEDDRAMQHAPAIIQVQFEAALLG